MAGLYERVLRSNPNTIGAHQLRWALFKYQAGHVTLSAVYAYLGVDPALEPSVADDLVAIHAAFSAKGTLAEKLEYAENIEASTDVINAGVPGADEAWWRSANQLGVALPGVYVLPPTLSLQFAAAPPGVLTS